MAAARSGGNKNAKQVIKKWSKKNFGANRGGGLGSGLEPGPGRFAGHTPDVLVHVSGSRPGLAELQGNFWMQGFRSSGRAKIAGHCWPKLATAANHLTFSDMFWPFSDHFLA